MRTQDGMVLYRKQPLRVVIAFTSPFGLANGVVGREPKPEVEAVIKSGLDTLVLEDLELEVSGLIRENREVELVSAKPSRVILQRLVHVFLDIVTDKVAIGGWNNFGKNTIPQLSITSDETLGVEESYFHVRNNCLLRCLTNFGLALDDFLGIIEAFYPESLPTAAGVNES
ncbi:hypothetical protein Tco_0728200 [Tanacetum coccineum]|uniref:Uncharacterized protein n=1 Tax=Tanacetum coccineum TaxID=301880 RepID=A0ABQ4YKH4_9ASTR